MCSRFHRHLTHKVSDGAPAPRWGAIQIPRRRESEKRMKCKRSIALLALALTLALVPVSLVQAKKPIRSEVEGWSEPFGWGADITSGPFEGKTMYWYTLIAEFKGSRVYFFEEWEIKDGEIVILAGFDRGVTRLKNGVFTGNGRVTYAMEGWEHLIGCKEHIGGLVDFVDPLDPTTWTFTATVQIN